MIEILRPQPKSLTAPEGNAVTIDKAKREEKLRIKRGIMTLWQKGKAKHTGMTSRKLLHSSEPLAV